MLTDNADEPRAVPEAGFLSARGTAQMHANARTSKICNFLTTAGFGSCALISLYTAWFYQRISSLGHQHGWGAIPPAEFPIAPAQIDGTFEALSWIETVSFVIGGVAFLISVTKIRRGVEALLGKGAFSYGWGWTIGSLFIPIVCLYRPWVGFAELRKAVKGLDLRKHISFEWKSDRGSGDTIILAATFIAGSIALKVLGDQATEVAGKPNFGLADVDVFVQLTQFDTAVRFIMLAVLVWFLWSLTSAAKRVAVTADAAGTFD